MKLKARLSLPTTKKLLHTIENNNDVKVVFDEYIIGMTHMVTILKRRKKSINGRGKMKI